MVKGILVRIHKVPDLLLRNQSERNLSNRTDRLHNPHSLSEIKNMRRSIKSHLEAERSQRRSQHIGHRALAIGARHMNDLIISMRMTQKLVNEFHIAYTRFIRSRTHLLE